ncbi:transporter substrate-binding domain-containing protein [Shewanella pealeana]|uniref:histidine kinase n=1 Tax=Shewanella pealeana (strain ATCC 700345 / ANG-SQ1) TaxID=398579 RepID=A8H0Z9_SHEPA|nr:transporter substrate-binding domain-containing protein [Shewanella pealeana]ABV86236.1 Hpt sensor hybrid histidine kinase [Shewanella pealeana ATCC 700345]
MRQALLILILFSLSFSAIAGQAKNDTAAATEGRVVRVGYPAADWQPFTYVSKDGKVIGLLPSILQEITINTGYRTENVIYPNYEEVTQALRQGEIDIIMGVSKTPSRLTWLSFSSPLMLVPIAGITNQKNINNLLELKGQRIAAEKGFAINEQLRSSASQVEVHSAPDSLAAYKSVLTGSSDAYIGNAITLDYLHTHQDAPNELSIRLLADVPFERLHLASQLKDTELVNQLNEGLKQIPSETFKKLYDAWLTTSQVKYIYQQHSLNLTEEEIVTISEKKIIKVLYSTDNYPYSFINGKGAMDGMGPELLKIAAQKLNITIEATPFNGNDIEGHLASNSFEIIPSYTCDHNILQLIHCTSPYIQDRLIGVAASNLTSAQLENSTKLGLLRRHKQQMNTSKDFPDADITYFASTKLLINAVIKGQIQVGIIPLSKANSLVSSKYLGRINIIPNPLGKQTHPVSFGVNKNNPILLSILNKAKNSIQEDELRTIINKWHDININSDFTFAKVPNWLLLVLGGVFSTFLAIAYSNRKLKNEIAQRHSIEKELRLVNSNFGGIVAQLVRYGDDVNDISWSYVSGNIEKYLGLTPEQLYQTPQLLLEFLQTHADDHEFLNDIQQSHLSDSLYTTLKLNIDGKLSWFQLTGVCTKIDKNRHWTFTLVDITLLKQKQAELDEARLIAESATEAKSRFLAMMSHEIRTPISGILSLLELMVPHINTHEISGIHKNLTHSGNNLLNIVNDVLDFSKIEAGKLGLSPAVCQLSSFICELAQPHIVHVERKGIKFKLWLDPKLAYSLTLDHLRLKQVLNNLLNNASKFTTEGEIWLSVDLISSTDTEQTIGFAVTDTGIGISEKDITKLFIPFEQVDLSSERRFSGTGLGLSICEQLVKLMGGEISVTSTQGQGSTFRFSLSFPIAAVEVPAIVNKRCGVMMLDDSDYDVVCEYLRAWQSTPYNLHCIDNKAALAAYAAKAQLQVILLPESWCEQQALTPSWAKRNLANVQIIQFRSQSMLSATPTELGWVLSVNPIIPEHLLHLITNPEVFETKYAVTEPKVEQQLTREQAISQNKLILVAEDHPINQDVIQMQLNKLGYFSDIFDDGQQALTAYKQNKYNLVLTDCHMPELDGYGLVSAIREHEQQEKLTRLAVIALTANAISSEKARCHQFGFDDYLIKPVTLEQLQRVLSEHLVMTQSSSNSNEMRTDGMLREPPLPATLTNLAIDRIDASMSNVIDIDALEANFGDRQLCINLLSKFIITSKDDIQLLSQAITEQNFEMTAHIAHKFKGAAGVIECERLVATCSNIETAASTQDIKVLKEYLVQIEQLIEQISNQVNQLT